MRRGSSSTRWCCRQAHVDAKPRPVSLGPRTEASIRAVHRAVDLSFAGATLGAGGTTRLPGRAHRWAKNHTVLLATGPSPLDRPDTLRPETGLLPSPGERPPQRTRGLSGSERAISRVPRSR